MTANEVSNIIKSGNKIDKNVFNFFPKYKQYESLLVINKGPLTAAGNDLIDRDTLIEYIKDPNKINYNMELLKIYDEIKYKMTWYDTAAIYSSSAQCYNCERYDLNNLKIVSESVYSLLDRDSGDRVYVASDQTTLIVRYDYNEEGEVIDPKTGSVVTTKVNQGNDRYNTEKHRHATIYNG